MSRTMRPARTLFLPIALAAAASAAAQRPSSAPVGSSIPTPESVFGFPIGKDSNLVDYEQSIDYFTKLAKTSNRIHLINVGTTSFGRPWTAAIITSPENYAKLDHYRQLNMRIAHPEGLTDSAAHRIAREGKVFVDISGGLHASEIAGSQHTPQLAYEILSHANDPQMKEIFDNVIFFLWPTINPDGQDIVVKNCRETMFGRPGTNEPYEKYMGHDNNRDSYMMNGIDSRVRQRVWREWEPDIIYVHHQSSPFPTRIWIPPFADPVGLRAPPIPAREINTIGTFIAQELDAHEQPGATHMLATYDAYYPGYIDYMPVYQNIPSWWTETQGGGCATTRTSTIADLPKEYQDTRPTPLYLSPWLEGKWSLRDAVNYMVTASIATLRYAAKFKEDVIYNRYQSGRDVVQKYSTKGPFAYIIPQEQHDPVAPVELLRRFAFHGIRISQLDRDASYNGTAYHRGDWVIPMNQEFASLVQEVFEVQHYPENADDNPYDAAGWTLPFQMGVNVVEAATPLSADFKAAMKPVPPGKAVDWHTAPDAPLTTNANAAGILPRAGGFSGAGDQFLLDPAQANSFKLIARALDAGGKLAFQSVGWTESLRPVGRGAGDGRRVGEGALGHGRPNVGRDRNGGVGRRLAAAHRARQRRHELDAVAVRHLRVQVHGLESAGSRRGEPLLEVRRARAAERRLAAGVEVAAAEVAAEQAEAVAVAAAVAPRVGRPTPCTRSTSSSARAAPCCRGATARRASRRPCSFRCRAPPPACRDATISPAHRSCRSRSTRHIP